MFEPLAAKPGVKLFNLDYWETSFLIVLVNVSDYMVYVLAYVILVTIVLFFFCGARRDKD